MSAGVVIDMREWCAARARNAKVRWLDKAVAQYCKGQGPYDALAKAMAARLFTDPTWYIIDRMASDLARRAGEPFTIPSSPLTRQLLLDVLEDAAREVRLASIEVVQS